MAIFSRQYKPWFFRDDAYAGRIVTSARLIRAVRMDNRKLIEKAVESSADLVKETRNEFGQSILHIAAAYGRSQLIQILATRIDIESVDLFRQTPIILAQKYHQEEAFTELRKLYFDVKKLEYKPQQSRWKRGSDALKVTMKVLRSTLYAHAEKLSLVAVYFTGMSSVDYLHMIYLLFFLVFFPWSRLARRFWISLVAYCEIALLLFYAWRVIEPLNINTSDAFKSFSDSTGLSRAEGNLSVALLSAATLVLVVVQLNFFRSQTERRHRAYASFERFVRRYGSKEDASIAWPLLYYVTTFFRHFGLILVYLTLILVLGLRSVSVINGGYLVILVVCMLIHQFSSKPDTVLKIIWPIVVMYSTFVLFLMYAYQFPTIATWIAGLYPKFLANNVFTLEDIGLVMYNDGQLMWHMLPPTAVCILVVTQYRVFLSRSRQQSVPNSKAARKLLSIQRFCVIFCDKNLHKLFTVIVFILCACQPSMFSFGYLTVLSLFMLAPNGMRHMVKFLSLSASVVALVVFGDQFKKIDEFVGTLISEDYQRFIGFRQHKILLDGIYAELLILIMGAVQHSFARWRRNDLPQQLPSQAGDVLHKEYDVAESPKHEVVRVRSSATGKKSASIELSPASGMDYHAFPDSRGGSSESSSSLSDTQARGTLLSVKSAQVSSSEMDKPPKRTVFMKFIRNLGPRLISLGRNLVNLYGVEMTVIALLIGAFYRETALSLLSIIFVVGGLVFRGPRFLKRFWCSMRTLMALFLIVQYWLADNVFKPPALTTDFGLSIDYRKWLSLSGYESNDLYWDFCAFFFASLYANKMWRRRSQRDSVFDEKESEVEEDDVIWDTLRFWFLFLSDKITLALILMASVLHVDLLSAPFLLIVFQLLLNNLIPVSRDKAEDLSFFARWSCVNNFCVVYFVIISFYQAPFLPEASFPVVAGQSPSSEKITDIRATFVPYQDVLGLNKFCKSQNGCSETAGLRNPFGIDGALPIILIFLVSLLQNRLFKTEAYNEILMWNFRNRKEQEFRGKQSVQLERYDRIYRYRRLDSMKREVQNVLKKIFCDSNAKEIGLESMNFDDREVWFKPREQTDQRRLSSHGQFHPSDPDVAPQATSEKEKEEADFCEHDEKQEGGGHHHVHSDTLSEYSLYMFPDAIEGTFHHAYDSPEGVPQDQTPAKSSDPLLGEAQILKMFLPKSDDSPRIFIDSDGRIVQVNSEMSALLQDISLLGIDVRRLFNPEPSAEVLDGDVQLPFVTTMTVGNTQGRSVALEISRIQNDNDQKEPEVLTENVADEKQEEEISTVPDTFDDSDLHSGAVCEIVLLFEPSTLQQLWKDVVAWLKERRRGVRHWMISHIDTTLLMSRSSSSIDADLSLYVKGKSPIVPPSKEDQLLQEPKKMMLPPASKTTGDPLSINVETEKSLDLRRQIRMDLVEKSTTRILCLFALSNMLSVTCFAFVVNVLIKSSGLALIPVVVFFAYALIEMRRPPQGFSIWLAGYTVAVVVARFLFQFPVFCELDPNLSEDVYSLQPNQACAVRGIMFPSVNFLRPMQIGIYKVSDSSTFSLDIFPDLVCLLLIVATQSVLRHKGVWGKSPAELGDPVLQTEFTRVQEEKKALRPTSVDDLRDDEVGSEPHSVPFRDRSSFLRALFKCPYEMMHKYFFGVLAWDTDGGISHALKPGKDLYLSIFLIEALSTVLIFFGYPAMTSRATQSVSESFRSSTGGQFSGQMVLFLFLQIFIIIWDRIAYLKRSLKLKLALQYSTLIYFSSLVFFIWPTKTERVFQSNNILIIYFLLKCIYWALSAAQIQFGYPLFDPYHDCFTRNASYTRQTLFSIYRAIPFVFELRTLLDWACKKTTLNLWETFKLEDIYSNIYIIKCKLLFYSTRARGEPQSAVTKFFMGTLLFCVLMLVVLGPLWLFSSMFPGNVMNNVEGSAVTVTLSSGNIGEIQLLSISSAGVMTVANDTMYKSLRTDNFITGDEEKSTIQFIRMMPFADKDFIVSEPNRNAFVEALVSNVSTTLIFEYSFQRTGPVGHEVASGSRSKPLTSTEKQQLSRILNTTHGAVNIAGVFPLHLQLDMTSDVDVLDTDAFLETRTFALSMDGRVWSLNIAGNSTSGIDFITISDKVLSMTIISTLGGTSIVTIYITVVLTIGSFLRLFVADLVVKIPYEDMNNVDSLLQICEGIYLSRAKDDFLREEALYRKLIRIFRDPQLLLRLTRRKVD
eukprot:846875_1